MSNKTYNTLKWVALTVLPAISALWCGLSDIWGLPYGTQIGGTIMLFDAFLGAILGISSVKYNKTNK